MILTAKNFRQLLTTPGRYRDKLGEIKGLLLVVENERNASWQLRYERQGRERWMGLGSARLIGLREARIRALAVRLKLLDGIDPLEDKRSAKTAAKVAELKTISFEAAATAYYAHHEDKWSRKHAAQFLSALRDYAFPVIGALPVADIDTGLVLRVMEQPHKAGGKLWDMRQETASRVLRRIEGVLDWAKARGYRSGDNPARWIGHLSEHLPIGKREVKHFAALPYTEAAAFCATLRTHTDIVARALEFTVLTAARSGETLGAVWSEIDFEQRLWTVPGERMKGGRVHRVPLSDTAIALLRDLPRETGNPHLFIGNRPGAPLEKRAMYRFLKKLGRNDTVHGIRSTFTDWAHDTTGYPKVVIDMAAAHVVGDKVEAAYRRSDLLNKRRRLMTDWAAYCGRPASADVVPLRSAR